MLRPLIIIFLCLAVAEIIIRLCKIPLPASILAMIFLFLLLELKIVSADKFKHIADFLLQNLMLFLIPPCLAIIKYFDLVKRDFFAITFSTIISTILVVLVSAFIHARLRK